MRLFSISIVAVAAILAFGIAPQFAAGADNFFDNASGNNWDTTANWSLGHEPNSTENAVIPVGETCEITSSNNAAASFEVYGQLSILSGGDLKITAGSIVDGLVYLESSGKLIIDTSLTIQSNNDGVIQLYGITAEIKDNGGGEVLTITNTCVNDEETCSVDIRGAGVISLNLVNNGAVIADVYGVDPPTPLRLTTVGKSGNGIWGAEIGGDLQVEVVVTGAGHWQIVDTDSNLDQYSRILIEATCDALCGTVQLNNGVFHAQESFCTGGNLTWASVVGYNDENTAPTIRVETGETATFKGACDCTS